MLTSRGMITIKWFTTGLTEESLVFCHNLRREFFLEVSFFRCLGTGDLVGEKYCGDVLSDAILDDRRESSNLKFNFFRKSGSCLFLMVINTPIYSKDVT